MKKDLKDVTFIIPFFCDSVERLENLGAILDYIDENFDTNVMVLEGGGNHAFKTCIGRNVLYVSLIDDTAIYTHQPSGTKLFWRTRVLNYGYKHATTPYIANWDCDVFFIPQQVEDAVKALRYGAVMVYPYADEWIEIARTYIKDKIITHSNTFGRGSLGGACLMNKKMYLAVGGESEIFVSYGAEDVCRYTTLRTLGLRVDRIPGPLYHIWHPRGVNSGTQNPMWKANDTEYEKIKAMNKEELEAYIKTYTWMHE